MLLISIFIVNSFEDFSCLIVYALRVICRWIFQTPLTFAQLALHPPTPATSFLQQFMKAQVLTVLFILFVFLPLLEPIFLIVCLCFIESPFRLVQFKASQ